MNVIRVFRSPYFHVPVIGLLLYIIVWIQPWEIFPDWLRLVERGGSGDLLSTMISVLAEVISITVTVVLIAFELYRQKTGLPALHYFQNSRPLAYLITTTLMAIILGYISFILVPTKTKSSNDLSVLYFTIWAGGVALVLLIPLALRSIGSLNIEKIVQYEISRIHEHIPSICPKSNEEGFGMVNKLNNDPTIILQNIAVKHIYSGERFTVQYINAAIVEKLMLLMLDADPYHEDKIVKRLVKYFEAISEECLEMPNNQSILKQIWLCVVDANRMLAESKLKSMQVIEDLNTKFVEKLFTQLAKKDYEDVMLTGVESIKEIFKIHYSNTAHEKDMYILWQYWKETYEKKYGTKEGYADFEYEHSESFRYLAEKPLEIFNTLAKIAIRFRNENILRKIDFGLSYLTHNYDTIKQDQILKMGLLEIKISLIQYDIYINSYEAGIYKSSMDAWNILPDNIIHLIRDKVFYLRNIINTFCRWILFMQKNDLMDDYMFGQSMLLKSKVSWVAEHLADHIEPDDEVSYNCLLDILNTCKIVLENISTLPEKPRYVRQIHTFLKDLRPKLANKPPSATIDLIPLLDELLPED